MLLIALITCTTLTLSSSQAFAGNQNCTLNLNGYDDLAIAFKIKNYLVQKN